MDWGFIWNFSNRYKHFFFVKVELNGIDDSFYMQYDTGTQQTLFYGKTLNALQAK